MFKCERCEQYSEDGEKPVMVVIEGRRKVYNFRSRVNRRFDPVAQRWQWVDDPGGEGWEIVREALMCAGCANIFISAPRSGRAVEAQL